MTDKTPQTIPSALAEDLLYGVYAIAAFIGEPPKKTYRILEKKYLPAGKVGDRWVASRKVLTAHLGRLTGAA